jgi:hypothetical protein
MEQRYLDFTSLSLTKQLWEGDRLIVLESEQPN